MPGPSASSSGAKRTSGTPPNLAKSAPISPAQSFSGRRDSGLAPPPPPPPEMPGSTEVPPVSQWAAFSGQLLQEMSEGEPPLSAFDQKLEETPPCTIESLLDEEEILQEFRRGNESLMERLSAYEGVRVLIEQVTHGPSESDLTLSTQEFRKLALRRRPWIACEMLTSGYNDALFDAFRQPGGSDLLDLVWSFFDSTPEPATAAALAGYFCSVVTTLVAQCAVEVATHLRSQPDPSRLFDLILQRIESRSFADLLIALLCVEVPPSIPEQVVFPRDRLAWRLVSHLLKRDSEPSVLEHVVLVIEALIARACAKTLHASDELLQQFVEADLLLALIDQVTTGVSATGCSASSVASATVLSIAVSHMNLLPLNPLHPVRSPDFRPAPPSPRTPPPPEAPTEEEMFDPSPSAAIPLNEDLGQVPDSCSNLVLESEGAIIVKAICSNLPRICSVFDAGDIAEERKNAEHELRQRFATGDVRDAVAEIRATALRLPCQSMCSILTEADASAWSRPISAIILEVVGLLAHLATTGRPEVFEAALNAAVLSRCLQAMFHFPWHTLLHNVVTSVFREFLVHRIAAIELVTDFLSRADLLERLVAEVQYDARVRDQCRLAETAGQPSLLRQRVGYAGHLRMVCQELEALSNKSPEVAAALEAVADWKEIVLPELEAASALTAEPLGGVGPDQGTGSPAGSPVRSEFDCRSALQTFMASLTDEVDLNLEDLRDLNEEMNADEEMDMAIAMAAAHAKHRSRGGAACPEPLDDDDDLAISQEAEAQQEAEHLDKELDA